MNQTIQVVVTVYPSDSSSEKGTKYGNAVEVLMDNANAQEIAKMALAAAIDTLEPPAPF